MTVKELKQKLEMFADDLEIGFIMVLVFLVSDCAALPLKVGRHLGF